MNTEKRDRLFSCMVNNLRSAEALAIELDGDNVELSIEGLSVDQIDDLSDAFYSVCASIGSMLGRTDRTAERRPARASRARSTDGTGKEQEIWRETYGLGIPQTIR